MPTRAKTDLIVVHCSDTPPSMDIGAKEIDAWHKEFGWSGIGYHFVIRRNGVCEEGRPLSQWGAHCLHQNDRSVGICLVGGDAAGGHSDFTRPQFQALEGKITWLLHLFPGCRVAGHKEFDQGRQCPGFDVKEWWYGGQEAKEN